MLEKICEAEFFEDFLCSNGELNWIFWAIIIYFLLGIFLHTADIYREVTNENLYLKILESIEKRIFDLILWTQSLSRKAGIFLSLFSEIKEWNLKDLEAMPEESVLLNIQAIGINKMSRLEIFKITALGFIIRLTFEAIFLPIVPFLTAKRKKFLPLASCLLVVFCGSLFSLSFYEIGLALYGVLIAFHLKGFSSWLKGFVFDLIDLLTFGSFTKIWLSVYFARRKFHPIYHEKFTSLFEIYPHICESRQLGSRSTREDQRELSEFLDFIVEARRENIKTAPSQIARRSDEYWAELTANQKERNSGTQQVALY